MRTGDRSRPGSSGDQGSPLRAPLAPSRVLLEGPRHFTPLAPDPQHGPWEAASNVCGVGVSWARGSRRGGSSSLATCLALQKGGSWCPRNSWLCKGTAAEMRWGREEGAPRLATQWDAGLGPHFPTPQGSPGPLALALCEASPGLSACLCLFAQAVPSAVPLLPSFPPSPHCHLAHSSSSFRPLSHGCLQETLPSPQETGSPQSSAFTPRADLPS